MNKKVNIVHLKIYFFIFIFISILNFSLEGIIQPDDILPLEISPTYTESIGVKGTQFIFRFFIPNSLDKNGMPTLRGFGAANGQYIGISFNLYNNDVFDGSVKHTCSMTRVENNLNIPLIPIQSADADDKKSIYCKINSFDNTNLVYPGYNYKLTITFIELIGNLNNLISITVFTSSSPNSNYEIFDTGTFNHINIIPLHSDLNPTNQIANLVADSVLNLEVDSELNFDVKIIFNDWFAWDDYIICLNLPKNQVITENPSMKLTKTSEDSNIVVPAGTINSINLETDDERKYIGFYLDGSKKDSKAGEELLMKFSGLKTKEAGLINNNDNDNNNDNNFIRIEIRYRNSYVICASKTITASISLGNVKFSVKHPETIDDNYIFDVFKGGAFQIEFTINIQKSVSKKYFLIKQKDSGEFKRVTFIASSCDFSNFNISSSNFNEIPKCFPIKNKNNVEGDDNYNGIFFYYPYNMKPKTDYKLKIWIFFDECGPDGNVDEDGKKVEINFYLEMYNNINKNKIGEKRIDSRYIFLNSISTERGIMCYNTYMGDKSYINGYLFNIDSYTGNDKLLYREYFNWNIYDFNAQSNINDGKTILEKLYSVEEIKPRFIYSRYGNSLTENTNLLLVNKIILDTGNNEKLGQFFPMGLSINNIGGTISAIQGKFFVKLSKNFFSQQLDHNGNPAQCYASWVFASPSIKDGDLPWFPEPKYYPKQKYNFITNSKDFFKEIPTALFNPRIEFINNYTLQSEKNEGWDESHNKAEWSFGDDENLEDQISDQSPVEIYFGFADTCHYWTNLEQKITSLYTPIEIILGVTGPHDEYLRVMRFIKLFPEGGVWHDNTVDTIQEKNDIFIRSNDFIVKNHFALNTDQGNDNDIKEKGVCLLEILNGILDSQEALSSNFFLWIFKGSLLDTDYDQISSTYPVGNLRDTAKAYGYSSQHSPHLNNFYMKPSENQNSDISSPIYNIATSMNSIYQSATSGYLFYLGSLIVFYNRVKRNSFYDLTNEPLSIPYYCPYYHSKGAEDPFSLGIFPSFIAGFGSFNSMTDFGNQGFEKLVAKKINNQQLNVLMLSGIKIVDDTYNSLMHCYNTVKFINYFNGLMTLDVWNSDANGPCLDNEYDSIDSFIFFFNEKITALNEKYPQPNIPNQLKSLSKSKKGYYCFYVFGKKFCSGLYGITNSDLLLTRNTPNSIKDRTPYLSINLQFEISQDYLKCPSSDKFCPEDLIGFWGISSNHDMNKYVTNYITNSFLIDHNIYRSYLNNNPPRFEFGQEMAFESDPAIFIKITFQSPFQNAILPNTILSFNIKDIPNAQCSVKSYDVNLPSSNCNIKEGRIQCQLIDSSLEYTIFCYQIHFGNGQFTFYNFKLNLPSENDYSMLGNLIFEDNKEYFTILPNSGINPSIPIIQAKYVTIPYNSNSYSKLEIKIDLKRPAYPGMKIEITFEDSQLINSFNENTECKFSLNRINSFSLNDIDIKDIDKSWTEGNAIIYNCEITPTYTLTATLDIRLYKAEQKLSNYAYIYIWPFKSIILDTKSVSLSITVNDGNNDKYILSNVEPSDKTIYFSNINQNIEDKVSEYKVNLFYISEISSNIFRDLSDYTFTFNLIGLTISKSISFAQIFFPKEINFECEECVKCYENSNSKTSMVNCNFEDYNILNIFFKSPISNAPNSNINIIITGIINPKESVNLKFHLNLINVDNSNGYRYSVFSSKCGNELDGKFILRPNRIERLRFYYYSKGITDKNPRNNADYTFRVGFDYANNDYSSTSLPTLNEDSLLYIYFPRDYHLYINENIDDTIITYYYVNGNTDSFSAVTQILGNKIKIIIDKASISTVKLKYIEIPIHNIKNPNKIISSTENSVKNKYTGYFKIVCLNNPLNALSYQYYYITGINSNTFRTDYITNENLRTNEYNWYRGYLIETDIDNKNKLIVDVLSDENTYNFIFLQPGRYKKVYFVTSSDNKNSNFYLNPNSTLIYFETNSKVKTLEENYIIPSLYGEPFEFYIGVPCSTNDGIYVVSPKISNTEQYMKPPSIIIYVRQIEMAKIEFIQSDIGMSPLNSKTRIYYYLSDINVDDLTIVWRESNESPNHFNKNIDIDRIIISGKTYTNKVKKISNIFSTANIKLKSGYSDNGGNQYFFTSSYINNCYELSPQDLIISESSLISYLNFDTIQDFKLSNDLDIITSESASNLLSNEIQLDFSKIFLSPSFILCELYCPYKSADEDNKLLFINYHSMSTYIKSVKQNYFRKYSNNYFSASLSSPSLTFSNVIKGYQYNAKCIYQSTQSDSNAIRYKAFTITSDKLHSTYPPKTLCNTFYFISPIDKEIQQKYINYCQYIMGTNLGYGNGGCIICSDSSGKIIPPGFSLNFPFICQNEKCYDKDNSFLIDDMYNLAEEFNTNSKTSKYEFTICATSNRICSSQISQEKFNSVFNTFVNNIKITENVNKLFNIDYEDINYIIYNGKYQNKIFSEDNIKVDDISIEFVSNIDKNGNAIWKASYNSEVNFNILCFWRIKISTYQTPTMEEMINCVDGDSFCGLFVANYGGHEYKIPDNKKDNIVVGEYTLYITCSHFVPSPIYFTPIKSVITMEIKDESFSKKLLSNKYINLFLYLILFL